MKLVVFDVDGTLVDSQHHIHGAMTAAFEGAGLDPLPREAVLQIVGLSLPVAVAHNAGAVLLLFTLVSLTARLRRPD